MRITEKESGLLLEEVIEGASGIGGLHCGLTGRTAASATGIPSFTFNRGAGYEKLALIPQVLFRDPLRNGLCAFELGRRIKVPAILAGAQVGLAFGTLAFKADIDRGRNDGATD